MANSVFALPGLIQSSGTTVTVPASLAWPLGTTLTESSAGTLGMVNSSAANQIQIPNGAGPEYGEAAWASNFYNVGTVTNGGTSRTTRVLSASTQVIVAPGGSDAFIFTATGPTKYAGLTAVGLGNPVLVAQQRTLTNTNATSTLTAFTVGAADGTFVVATNINVTAATVAAMTCTCTYTDETNTSRVATFLYEQNGTATFISSITNALGSGAYASTPLMIQAKAGTTITVATTGTVTGITYNLGWTLLQLV